MVVRVVKVRRRERPGWLERSYVPMIVKALRVTARHFVRNLAMVFDVHTRRRIGERRFSQTA